MSAAFTSTVVLVTAMLTTGLIIGLVLYFAICGVMYWRDIVRENREGRHR